MSRKWPVERLGRLRYLAALGMPREDIAAEMGASVSAIVSAARRHGIALADRARPAVPEDQPPPADDPLRQWLEGARRGERIEYHRGFLARSIEDGPEGVPMRRRLRWLQEMAERGIVHLVQKRHGPDDYSYLAVKV